MQSGGGQGEEEDDDQVEDEDDDQVEDEDEHPETRDPPSHSWYAVPTLRTVVFVLVGGWYYQVYWMYRCWRCYQLSGGYSRHEFWRQVHEHTGYQISPAWRALLGYGYCFSLFPAVAREARLAGIAGLRAPLLLALLYNFTFAFTLGATRSGFVIERLLQAAIFGALQMTLNRLSLKASGSGAHETVTGGELTAVVVGGALGALQLGVLS